MPRPAGIKYRASIARRLFRSAISAKRALLGSDSRLPLHPTTTQGEVRQSKPAGTLDWLEISRESPVRRRVRCRAARASAEDPRAGLRGGRRIGHLARRLAGDPEPSVAGVCHRPFKRHCRSGTVPRTSNETLQIRLMIERRFAFVGSGVRTEIPEYPAIRQAELGSRLSAACRSRDHCFSTTTRPWAFTNT